MLNEMAFDPGDFPSFVHPQKKQWIETGDPELDALLPTLSEGTQTYLEMISSQAYKDMVKRLERYTGAHAEDIELPRLFSVVYQSLQSVQDIEKSHTKELEQLALETVLNLPEFKMVKEAYEEGDVKFDIKMGPAELNISPDMKAEEGELSEAEEINLDLAQVLEDADDAMLRRRLQNLLIQGNATLKTYLFNLVSDKLRTIDPDLIQMYGILAVAAQLGYWITPFGIEGAGESGVGSEEVIPEGDDYVIKVRALNFPYLIHELVKGINEWTLLDKSLEGAMKKDTLARETEDIIIGPQLSKILSSYIPSSKQELFPLVQKMFTKLSRKEVKEVFAQSRQGDRIMQNLIDEAEDEWDDYKRSAFEDTEQEPQSWE